jgi:hypothetical protein
VHAEKLYAGIRPGTTLVTDGYEVYNGIAKAGGLTHLGCWVHARRPFIKAEESIPKAARSPNQLASRFVRLIGKLYRAEALAKGWTPARRCDCVRATRYLVALFKKLPLAQTVDDYEALTPWNIELGAL